MDMVTILSQPETGQHDLKLGHSIWKVDLRFKKTGLCGRHAHGQNLQYMGETSNVKVLLENEDVKAMFSTFMTASSGWNRQPLHPAGLASAHP